MFNLYYSFLGISRKMLTHLLTIFSYAVFLLSLSGCANTALSVSNTSESFPQLVIQRLESPNISNISITKSGNMFAVPSQNGFVDIWNSKPLSLASRIHTGILPEQLDNNYVQASISPNGRLLATATNNILQIWDIQSEKLVKTIGIKSGSSYSWTADSKRIITTKYGDGTNIINLSDQKITKSFPGAISISFSDDTRTAAVMTPISNALKLKYLNAQKNGKMKRFSEYQVDIYETSGWHRIGSIYDLSILSRPVVSPDGKTIAIVGQADSGPRGPAYGPSGTRYEHELKIKIYNLNGRIVKLFPRVGSLDGEMKYLQFTSDGTRIISNCSGASSIWDIKTGKLLYRIPGHSEISPDGNIAIITSNNTLSSYNIRTRKYIDSMQTTPVSIYSVAFSADGKQVIAGDHNSIRLWDIENMNLLTAINRPSFVDIYNVGFINEDMVFTSGFGGAVFWDKNSGKITREIHNIVRKIKEPYVGNVIDDVLLSPDCSKKMVIMDYVRKKEIVVKNDASGSILSRFPVQLGVSQRDISCSQNGDIIAWAEYYKSRKIYVYNTTTGSKINEFFENDNCTAWGPYVSPNGKLITLVKAVTYMDKRMSTVKNSVSIYPVDSDKSNCSVSIEGRINKVIYSPDNSMIALVFGDKTKATLYSTDSLKEITSVSSNNEIITDLAFSSDNKQIVTGDITGAVRTWDIKTGNQTAYMLGFTKIDSKDKISDWIGFKDDKYRWTKGAEKYIKWRIKGKLHPASAVKNANTVK